MAKTKQEKEQLKEQESSKVDTPVEESVKEENKPSYDELMAALAQLTKEVQTLKENANQPVVKEVAEKGSDSQTNDLLNMLANRKSDREVTIVHNMEMNSGLTTHIVLSTVTIDFRHVGEQRVLSWQQFEECVSKYHNFFEKEIILLSADNEELAARYGVSCVTGKKRPLTHKDIERLPKMSVRELEDFVESLSDNDKEVVFSYWLGKCYERVDGFYDRYKMDTLNRLSKDGCFNNILLVMNGESIIDKK